MILVLDAEDEVALWVGHKIGAVIVPPYTALGWRGENGALIAGVVFNDFNGANVEITAAADRLTRGMIVVALHYAFEQLQCRRVSLHVARGNERVRAMAKRAGFVEECIKKDFTLQGDVHSLRLLRRDNRWTA